MPRRSFALTVASALVLVTAACGNAGAGSDGSGTPEPETLAGVSVSGEVGKSLEVTLESPITAEETTSALLEPGTGSPLELNDKLLLQLYVGNGTSGDEAANTYAQAAPAQVTASEGQLFQVLLEELVGKPSGSRVGIVAKASDVWGEQGASQLQISKTDTVVFVADIVSVEPDEVLDGPEGKAVEPPENAPGIVEKDKLVTGFDWSTAPKNPPKKLTVIPVVEGDGPAAKAGSIVTFNYLGAVYGAKKPFDESFSREPVPFGVGIGSLIPAWDNVIPGLKRGSRVMIIAPPGDAYGDTDQPGIPADSTLVFVVDVLGVDA